MDRVIGNETENDLLRVLMDALERQEPEADEADTITSSELAAHIGLEQSAATRRLRKLMAAGVLRPEMVRRTDVWGRTRTVPGYRLVAESDTTRSIIGDSGA